MIETAIKSTDQSDPLSDEELQKINAYWCAANYLSVGQIYLLDNPLLKQPLTHDHIKPRLLGHWGTTPGLNLIYAYFNRIVNAPDLNVMYITGPGHGGPGLVANTWLEGTYSEVYPNVAQDVEGMKELFKQFSFPGGIPSHCAPETAGSIIKTIQREARDNGVNVRPQWPMIILRTPKEWTGPKEVDGEKTEGYWRSHQVPFAEMATKPAYIQLLEQWMKCDKPEELFDDNGILMPELAELSPKGEHRMGANPHANGGLLLKNLRMPNFCDYAVEVPDPGQVLGKSTRIVGTLLRDVMQLNKDARNFRVMGPDESKSNRLGALLEVTNRTWMAETLPEDDHLGPDGRMMEVLSEHTCQGWLEGYLLTGRHGLFSCYEAFIHIIDSMFNQHAKWLKVSKETPWRQPIASLNYLLTSHVWRQDHNGIAHQDPGFIDHVVNNKADIIRVYLPPDVNTLLAITDKCLRSRDFIYVIVAGKQQQWLNMDAAIKHCSAGIGIWEWASNDQGSEPDV